MKVDLDELRGLGRSRLHEAVRVRTSTLEALLAVVDAARNGVQAWRDGAYSDIDCGSLEAALEPFGPERPDRAWEEVDRWHAARDLAVKAAVDETRRGATAEWRTMIAGRENYERLTNGPPPPDREAIRDQLADAGVAVQRQFRSDQERIAELERERDEWKGRHKAVTNGLSNHVARADQAEERLARVPALVEAARGLLSWVDGCCAPDVAAAMRGALAGWERP